MWRPAPCARRASHRARSGGALVTPVLPAHPYLKSPASVDSIVTGVFGDCSNCGIHMSGCAIAVLDAARKSPHDLRLVTDAAKAAFVHEHDGVAAALPQLDNRAQR